MDTEPCPDAKELCKSRVDWEAFRKKVFAKIKISVEEAKTDAYSLCTTGWIIVDPLEFSDPRFKPFVKELQDHHWTVTLADGGIYPHMMSVSAEFVH